MRIQRCGPVEVPLPTYRTKGSSGLDLHLASDENVVLAMGGGRAVVHTGIKVAIPEGFEGQVRPRSGLAATQGLTVLNSPGTIDADYRGEIQVCLVNTDPSHPIVLRPLERIAQLVICPVVQVSLEEVEQLDATERGERGYGSTGT